MNRDCDTSEIERLRRRVDELEKAQSELETTKSALRAAERRLKGILEIAVDAVICVDRSMGITLFNHGAEAIFGYDADEVMGEQLDILIPERFRDIHRRHMEMFLASSESARVMGERGEISGLRRTGEEFPAEASISKFTVDGETVFTVILRDVTERVRTEEEVRKARDEAVAASRFKSQFLATMSHEIRTPMNGVMGMTDLLLDTPLDKAQREFVEIIRQSSEALLSIINDVLDFSRIEAGRLDIEEDDVNPVELVENTVELLASRARDKGNEMITFVGSGVPSGVRGDPIRLRQVLINLVGNAVKFTEHGEVVVRVKSEPGPDHRLRFTVTDTGVGISDTQQQELFQPFVQGRGTYFHAGGSGLGLAISKRLVELMNGEIGVMSREGEGSTFWFSVPLPPLPNHEETWEHTATTALRGLRVLVVDRCSTRGTAVARYLSGWGVEAELLSEGAKAAQYLVQEGSVGDPFDVVIVDSNQGSLSPIDWVREAQVRLEEAGAPNARYVLMTPFDLPGEMGSDRNGFDARLAKPVKKYNLLECVGKLTLGEEEFQRLFGTSQVVGDAEPALDRTRDSDDLPVFTGKRVLVAEDNQVNQKVVRLFLEKLGVEVEVVGDGKQAIDRVKAGSFDAVLMDGQMPEVNGFDATKAIRAYERKHEGHIPIIALTASAMEGDAERCYAVGMDDYMTKPILPDRLLEVLTRWLQSGEPLHAASPKAATSADLPLDFEVLEQLYQGDVRDQLLELFVVNTAEIIDSMETAVQKRDYESLQGSAHELKGSCSMVTAHQLESDCRRLQKAAQENRLEGLTTILDELKRSFAETKRAIAAHRWEEPSHPTGTDSSSL